jgi:NAD(P)-dependent dehydrogenase (short-subunit alcohol dehydrogenase family)
MLNADRRWTQISRMAQLGAGSIINVASTSGLRAAGRLLSYGAAKAGLLHLTSIMALELVSRRIRVNALPPGNTETDMHEHFESVRLADHSKRCPAVTFLKMS